MKKSYLQYAAYYYAYWNSSGVVAYCYDSNGKLIESRNLYNVKFTLDAGETCYIKLVSKNNNTQGYGFLTVK